MIGPVPAWLSEHVGDVEHARAAAPATFDGLLEGLTELPLAADLLVGASAFRVPFDLLGLIWQVGQAQEVPERDPVLDGRLGQIAAGLRMQHELGQGPDVEALGVGQEEMLALMAYQTRVMAPPVKAPPGFEEACGRLIDLGLLERIPGADPGKARLAMHTWTVEQLLRTPLAEQRGAAHRRAGRYWRWRAGSLAQPPADDVQDLQEASYHFDVIGDDEALDEVARLLASAARAPAAP
jgi:hypothetical protein